MIRAGIATVAFSICASLSGVHAGDIPGSSFSSGNWVGAAYTDDQTGQFSHCVISAGYRSGDQLFFSVNRDASVGVGVANPSLGLQPGTTFPVALFVDRRAPFYGTATAINDQFAVLQIPDFQRAMTALKKGYSLRVEALGRTGSYDLSGTFRALEATRQCAMRYYNYRDAQPANGGLADAGGDKTLLYQVATQMIAEVGASDFRYLTEEEAKQYFTGDAVLWTSDSLGIIGGALVAERGSMKNLRESDSADTQALSAMCDGDFATSARALESTNIPARELRLLCTTSGRTDEIYITKMLAGAQVLYTYLKFSGDAELGADEAPQGINENVALRAASFVTSE